MASFFRHPPFMARNSRCALAFSCGLVGFFRAFFLFGAWVKPTRFFLFSLRDAFWLDKFFGIWVSGSHHFDLVESQPALLNHTCRCLCCFYSRNGIWIPFHVFIFSNIFLFISSLPQGNNMHKCTKLKKWFDTTVE